MRFGFDDFCYFLTYRPLLAASLLIPSFVRVEYSGVEKALHCTDITSSFDPTKRASVPAGNYVFIVADNPYCAVFVLDQPLAREYIASRSFDQERSKDVTGRGVRERAAMGMYWENAPDRFPARHAIPIDLNTHTVPGECWIAHLPNNYARDPSRLYGKVAMVRLVEKSDGVMEYERSNFCYLLPQLMIKKWG